MGCFDWKQLKASEGDALYRRDLAVGDDIMLARVKLYRGIIVAPHQHESEEIIVVIQGAWRFSFPDRDVVVGKNQVLSIPAGISHSSEALEDTVAFDIFQRPTKSFGEDEDPDWRYHPDQNLWAV